MARVTILDSVPVNKNTIYNNLYKYLMDNNYTNMILIDLVPNSYNSRLFNITGNNRIIDVEHWYTDDEFHPDEFLQNKGTLEEDEDPISFNLRPEFLDSLHLVKLAHTGKWYFLSSPLTEDTLSLIKFVPDSIAFKPVKLDNSSNKNLIKDCFEQDLSNLDRATTSSTLKCTATQIYMKSKPNLQPTPVTKSFANSATEVSRNFFPDKHIRGTNFWFEDVLNFDSNLAGIDIDDLIKL